MDPHLISLARAVKRRRRTTLPTLWLFTDSVRHPNLAALVATLPPTLCGVVFRHDAAPDRASLAHHIARVCRARRIALVIAGDWRLAAACRAGLHLRSGQRPRTRYRATITTASAHDRTSLRAAARAGATLVFLSPAFATATHPGATCVGAVRWSALARTTTLSVLALGGVDGNSARYLTPLAAGFGAIGALSST